MKEGKLLEIINHYGVLPQLKYFQSEVFELNEAILEYEHINNYDILSSNFKSYGNKMMKEHIAEELADVFVMLLQFKEYYHLDGNDILRIMNEKIERQLDRITKEEE